MVAYKNIIFDTAKRAVKKCDKSAVKVIIPQQINGITVKSICDRAFRNCGELKSLVLPDTVETIGCQAFQGCAALTSVKLPPHIKRLVAAFEDCKELRSIEFSDEISVIGCYSFYGTALESAYIPEGVKQVGTAAFYNCNELKNVVLPKSLKKIEHHAFDILNDGLMFYVPQDSYAERYVRRRELSYRVKG